jgi:MFS family permease
VLLAVYSAYFQGGVVGGPEGTRLWGISVGIAMLVVAVTAPVLGAIADFSGAKKRLLAFYTVITVLFTSLLFFATPGQVAIGMIAFILAEIGYRSGQVFYNALLPEIARPEEIGRVSGYGWAIGNIGGILCLLIILPLIVFVDNNFVVRLSLVITAVFFASRPAPFPLAPRARRAQAAAARRNLRQPRRQPAAPQYPHDPPLQRVPQVHGCLPRLRRRHHHGPRLRGHHRRRALWLRSAAADPLRHPRPDHQRLRRLSFSAGSSIASAASRR